MQISAESVKFCFYTEHAPKSNMESELNLSFDEKKDRLNKDQRRISNLLLSIKFTRSLPLKIIENMKQILSLKKFFSYAFLNIRFASQGKV